MKKTAKKTIVKILGRYVRKLQKENDFKVVAVVGSIGKTSIKFAIAGVLSEQYKVRFQEGNYNDIMSVPLIFFDMQLPNILNPAAWAKTIVHIKQELKKPYPYDVVVVELGTDGPGQIAAFSEYLKADITVISAITPEHMEYFANIDKVAEEELSVMKMTSQLVANVDLIDGKYLLPYRDNVLTYGTKNQPIYLLNDVKFSDESASFSIENDKKLLLSAEMDAVSIAELYSATAAIVVAQLLNVPGEKIKRGIRKLAPVSGRMQRLHGIKNSLIIDETYNASPDAVKAALDSLYAIKAPQKIAILGNMNELGHMSELAHLEVGEYCEPNQLDLVITIGPDANKFIAAAARKQGCIVEVFDSPYAAGKYLQSFIKEGALILAKGSQNGVFAEETIKMLLANPKDASKLVRQNSHWLKVKAKRFGREAV
jgi:UDP-N-acetylmuramoyl-tripeptide--D-alanyl-D-alanine ligase